RGVALAAAVLGAVACDGDDGGGTKGDPICEAWADYGTRCGSTDTEYVDECRESTYWSYVRADFKNAMAACLDTLACEGASDDDCILVGLDAIGVTVESVQSDEGYLACAERTGECPGVND